MQTSMAVPPDAYKKTHISQLLNPQSSSSATSFENQSPNTPVHQHHAHNGEFRGLYGPPYQQRRLAPVPHQNGPASYQSPPFNPHDRSMLPPQSLPQSAFPDPCRPQWQHPPRPAAQHQQPPQHGALYGPCMPPLSAASRPEPVLQHGASSDPMRSPATRDQPTPPPNSHAAWQASERASVRIHANGARRYDQFYAPPVVSDEEMVPSPTTTTKRRSAEVEDAPQQPKPKKAKANGEAKKSSDSATNSSANGKRGFNAKKRKEQQIKQSAVEGLSLKRVYPHPNGKRTSGQSEQLVRQELQNARCMANKYKDEVFPRCVSCTRRWAGDTCRFQGIRLFCRNAEGVSIGFTFVPNKDANVENMKYPSKWNIPLSQEHVDVTKRTVAAALLTTLKRELEHSKADGIVRRWRESDVRATCDTCMTSLFCCTWMCRKCGRESCAECFAKVKELTDDPPANLSQADLAALKQKRERHQNMNPFFLTCQKREDHSASDFNPVSRFNFEELENAVKNMQAVLEANGEASVTPKVSIPEATLGGERDGIPSYTVPTFSYEELSDDVFRAIWPRGEPIRVTGALERLKVGWTPQYFIDTYGDQSCLVSECQLDENKSTFVRDFFKDFGRYDSRDGCWKLKDWPPKAEFKKVFPELFEDFHNAVPMPNYVRRDGTLNLSSHFPVNTVSPDLGPKMYNAMANTATQDCKGSTRLHMDMSDALNIMTFSTDSPDGSPGCAAWDIFKSEDSQKIRGFLQRKFKIPAGNDPIHTQQYYLDDALRRELWQMERVASFRIYQRPGEAIFIPAGCAHQVCNSSDSIKVAIDFVSPENVNKCEQLTKEFREQNQGTGKQWKEDVLQLKTMMWFAWASCERWESEKNSKATENEGEKA